MIQIGLTSQTTEIPEPAPEIDFFSQDVPENTQEYRNLTENKYIGQPITEEKGKDVYRLYAGNPNGVKIGPKGGEYGEYLEEMKRMKSDTTCLFEVNLDTLKHEIRENLFKTTRNIFDHNRLNISSSSVPSKHDYKPGGTLIMTQGNFKGRVIDSGRRAGTMDISDTGRQSK